MAIPTLIFVTYKGNKKTIIPTKIFVTYKKSDVIHDSIFADTSVKVANKVSGNFDTAYLQTYKDVGSVDTGRKLLNRYALAFDTQRSLHASSTDFFDTTRMLTGAVYYDSLQVDTAAVIIRRDPINVDTLRNVSVKSTLVNDTSTDTLVNSSSLADTVRQTTHTTIQDNSTFDTFYSRVREDGLQADTAINKQVNDRVFNDTVYRTRQADILAADTVRSLMHQYAINADTSITIPYLMRALNPSEINISLEKGQLSETFEITTPVDVALESAIKGKLLDFAYNFRAYSSSGRGLMRTITGMYDIDKLLYTPFTYAKRKDSSITAKDHAGIVAKLLDKSLDFYADNFYPSEAFTGINGATIQNIISGLFGWTGNLPQDWINVILRGDRLKVVQRGHEPNTIDITGTKHSRPQVDRRLMRSVWGGSVQGTHEAHPLNISPLGYTGTIRFGDSEVTYHFGLVTREVTTTAEGTTTTTYDYDYDDYLTRKVMETPDETITTDYTYAVTLNDKYLATETAVSVPKGGDDSSASTTITQHVYLGNGWYGTSVYMDGVFQSSNVSNGKPGAKANKYTIDQSNLNLGAGYPDSKNRSYEAAALFDTSFPISDTKTLKKLTRDIEWLDRKTEVKLTMDIWQYGHLIDFTDKIIYNGNTYYLESNQVQRTPTELKQTVSIIRWY